jgi:hypothetical protein
LVANRKWHGHLQITAIVFNTAIIIRLPPHVPASTSASAAARSARSKVVRDSGARSHVSRLARVMTSTTGGDDDDEPADFFDSAEDNEDDDDDDEEDDDDDDEVVNALCADTRGTACRKGRRCGMIATCVLATPSASAMATIRSMAAPRIHVLGWHSSGAHFCGSVSRQRDDNHTQ